MEASVYPASQVGLFSEYPVGQEYEWVWGVPEPEEPLLDELELLDEEPELDEDDELELLEELLEPELEELLEEELLDPGYEGMPGMPEPELEEEGGKLHL